MKRTLYVALLVFLISASVFSALRSRDIFTVDGAFRCLEVQHRQRMFFHESNHLLYPVNVLLWSRGAKVAGVPQEGAAEFFASTALMNAFAAASCLAVLFLLVAEASSSVPFALGVVVAYGCTRAFLLHATTAAEPLLGVFWSLLAIAMAAYAVRNSARWPVAASALLFALALATYQSTLFLAPAALVLLLYGRARAQGTGAWTLRGLGDLLLFVLAGAAGSIAIFGWAYYREGVRSPALMVARFLGPCSSGAFLGSSLGKSLNLPFGLIRNTFPLLTNYRGLRGFLAAPKPEILLIVALLLALAILLLFATRRLLKSWGELRLPLQIGVLTAVVGLASTTTPLLIWDSHYDKLWLQPLACLIFLLAVSLRLLWRSSPKGAQTAVAICALVLGGLLLNFPDIVKNHTANPVDVAQVQQLAEWIGTDDLLIGDWDRLSTIYGYGWAKDGQFLSYPTEAVQRGTQSNDRLRNAIERSTAAGGRIYFLQILDEPREAWNSFLGSRCGVPFDSLDAYRANSTIRFVFQSASGPVVLRELNTAGAIPSSPAEIRANQFTQQRKINR